MQLKHIIIKLIWIALCCFMLKTAVEVLIEWSTIFPLQVRTHRWGNFSTSIYYILFDFALHIWIYILVTVGSYLLISRFPKIHSKIWYGVALVLLILILLLLHNFQFPVKQYYLPEKRVINYKFIEEWVAYLIAIYAMIFMIHKLQKKSFNISK